MTGSSVSRWLAGVGRSACPSRCSVVAVLGLTAPVLRPCLSLTPAQSKAGGFEGRCGLCLNHISEHPHKAKRLSDTLHPVVTTGCLQGGRGGQELLEEQVG